MVFPSKFMLDVVKVTIADDIIQLIIRRFIDINQDTELLFVVHYQPSQITLAARHDPRIAANGGNVADNASNAAHPVHQIDDNRRQRKHPRVFLLLLDHPLDAARLFLKPGLCLAGFLQGRSCPAKSSRGSSLSKSIIRFSLVGVTCI